MLITLALIIVCVLMLIYIYQKNKYEAFNRAYDCSCNRKYLDKYFKDVNEGKGSKYNFNNRPYLPLFMKKKIDHENQMEFKINKPLYDIMFEEARKK